MGIGVLAVSQLHGKNSSIIEMQTLAFTTLALFQIVNVINCRSQKQSIFQLGFWSNRYIAIGIFIALILQILAVQTSFMNLILGTSPLDLIDWGILVSAALISLFAEELRKFFVRKTRVLT
jgi:magnesium-transporting ATPase (P-type)